MMESFAVDKSFYDIGTAEELKELWEAELDPAMQDVLKLQSGDMTIEWSYIASKDIPGVILHDKLMTDAALGTRPIKSEHSYSLASDGDSLPDSPISHNKVDDMEDECFPAISMNTASIKIQPEEVMIKDEPCSETDSNHSSSPPSPHSIYVNSCDIPIDVEMSPSHHQSAITISPSTNILLTSPHAIIPRRFTQHSGRLPAIKIESSASVLSLPPTPPSCTSSSDGDSEDNATISQPSSPVQRKVARMVIGGHTTTRQPINTPLISSQPKGSIGTLNLTEEEKRTLIAEGYPVPTRLPLTKAEEKSLKKIRRKIKNKISAQESRRKKKEYMDQLEKKVELLVTENTDYRQKIERLEDSNSTLLKQLKTLEAIVAKSHPQIIKQLKQTFN